MAALTGNTIASTYTELLRMGNATLHATTGYYIKDSADTNSALSIATTRVGIGTATPGAELDIKQFADNNDFLQGRDANGDIVFRCATDADGDGIVYIEKSDSSETIRLYSNGDSYFTGGNVGIGTTSPQIELHVDSAAQATAAAITYSVASGTIGDTNTLGLLNFGGKDNNNTLADGYDTASIQCDADGAWDGSNRATKLRFNTTNVQATTTKMTIRKDGNVGIGTTAPSYQLDIGKSNGGTLGLSAGISGTNAIIADGTALGTIYFHGWDATHSAAAQLGAMIRAEAADAWDTDDVDQAPTELQFFTNDNSTTSTIASPRMTINADGKVGIGNTSPSGVLDVKLANGTDSTYVGYFTNNDTDSSYGVVIRAGNDSGDASFVVQSRGATEYFKVRGDGNVGIGTASPEGKLNVVGGSAGTWAPYTDADELVIECSGNGGMQIASPNASAKIIAFSSPGTTTTYDAIIQGYNSTVHGAAQLFLGTYNNSNTLGLRAGNVGIQCMNPYNRLSAAPIQYSTGTASQSGTTVTGSGTTFTAAMVGSQFIYNDGTSSGAITKRVSNTDVRVTTSQTVSPAQGYKIHYQGLQVTSAGAVGIGISAPEYPLHVRANTVGAQVLVESTEDGDTTAPAIELRRKRLETGVTQVGEDGDYIGALRFAGYNDNGTPEHVFYGDIYGLIVDATDGSEDGYMSMRTIKAGSTHNSLNIRSGNVGIAQTTPTYQFEVNAAAAGSYSAWFGNNGDDATCYGIIVAAGADNGSGTTYYLNAQDGDGTNTGYLKTVSGTFSLADTSDIRLKKDVVDTSIKGLDSINAIKVRDFKWKKSGESVTAGFIANELQEVCPHVVGGEPDAMESYDAKYDDDGNITKEAGERIAPMTVSRDLLVPVLVKAIQELTAKVEALENNNEQGESSNEQEQGSSNNNGGDASSESQGEDSGGVSGDSSNSSSSVESGDNSSESRPSESADSSNESSENAGSSGSDASADSEEGSGGDDSSGSGDLREEWTKDQLKAYMDTNSISYNSGDTKQDLLDKIGAANG